MATYGSQLVNHRRVEHHVGILLVRKDPLIFATPHAVPTRDGLLRRVTAVAVVSHHATQQSIIRSGNPVMIVQGYGDRKSTRLNSSHVRISYAVFCLKKKKIRQIA